jgi:hypothetical protein
MFDVPSKIREISLEQGHLKLDEDKQKKGKFLHLFIRP